MGANDVRKGAEVTLIRTTSHRSRRRLAGYITVDQWFYTWEGDSGLCYVPTALLDDILSIPGITKVKRLKGELLMCWKLATA